MGWENVVKKAMNRWGLSVSGGKRCVACVIQWVGTMLFLLDKSLPLSWISNIMKRSRERGYHKGCTSVQPWTKFPCLSVSNDVTPEVHWDKKNLSTIRLANIMLFFHVLHVKDLYNLHTIHNSMWQYFFLYTWNVIFSKTKHLSHCQMLDVAASPGRRFHSTFLLLKDI